MFAVTCSPELKSAGVFVAESQVVEASFVDWCHAALHLGEVCVVLGYTELLFSTGTPILLHPQHRPHER